MKSRISFLDAIILCLGWTVLLIERNVSITISRAGNPSIRNPVSRETISDFVELCETQVCFLHISLTGTNVRLPKMHRIPPEVDVESSRSPAKSEFWKNPVCNAAPCFSRARPGLATTSFGHDLVWPRPGLATTWFGHDLTNFGHGQFGAFSRVKRGRGGVGAREWRAQGGEGVGPKHRKKCGSRRVGTQTQKRWGPEGWGPEGWGAQNFALFFPPPAHIFILFFSLQGSSRLFFLSPDAFSSFFLSLGVFSWNFGGVLVGRRGVSQDNLKAKTSTFEVPTDQNTTKIPREDPQREEKRHEKASGERKKDTRRHPEREKKRREDPRREKKKNENVGGRRKKSAKFWAVRRRAVRRRAVPRRAVRRRAVRRRAVRRRAVRSGEGGSVGQNRPSQGGWPKLAQFGSA